MISPVFEKLEGQFGNIEFYKVDVDEQSVRRCSRSVYRNDTMLTLFCGGCQDVAQEIGVKAMPTFVFFKGGEKLDSVVGANPQALQVRPIPLSIP